MQMEQLLTRIEPVWRQAFIRFIQTGEAEDAFLNYLDTDASAQEVVEEAFTIQAAGLERVSELLKDPARVEAMLADRADELSTRLAMTLSEMAELPDGVQHSVAQKTVSVLESTVPPERRKRVESFVADLDESVAEAG